MRSSESHRSPAGRGVVRRLGTLLLCGLAWAGALAHAPAALAAKFKAQASSNLVIVVDGLRPDYITADLMPNLFALGKRGVFYEKHHSVFPTVTRVNAASFSTGAYPARHGLMGNEVYIPEASPTRTFDTSDYKQLIEIEKATGGELLTAPTLAQILEAHGKRLLAISSGSTGSAYLLNHETYGVGVIHPEFIVPETLEKKVLSEIGPAPEEKPDFPAPERVNWTVAAYVKLALEEFKPALTLLWITEPDRTAHKKGLGSPEFVAALATVDNAIGNIVTSIVERGRRDDVNIMVVSDHGFATSGGGGNLAPLLIQAGLKASPSSTDVVVAGTAIYVKDHDERVIGEIVRTLQKTPWVGPIFTRRERPNHPEGFIPGTFSFAAVHWDHPRAGDILMSPDWSDETRHGYKGVTMRDGVAGHGAASPFEIRATLVAAGPDFKKGVRIKVPSANVDLAPTLCRLFGIDPPDTMDGRVLEEALVGGPAPESVKVARRTFETHVVVDGIDYRQTLQESAVNGKDYFDFARATRAPAAQTAKAGEGAAAGK